MSSSMRKNHRRRHLFAWTALTGAMLLLAWRLLQDGGSLCDAATIRYPLHGKQFVGWLSNSEAVVLQYDRPGGSRAPTVAHPYVVDTRTGGSSPLTELDGLWGKEQLNGAEMPSVSGSLSRDGKSLLLRCGFTSSRVNGARGRGPITVGRFYVMDALDKNVQLLPIVSPFTWAYWGSDSKTVVAIRPGRAAQSKPIPVLPQLTLRYFPVSQKASPSPTFLLTQKHSAEWPVGYTADGRLLSSLNRAVTDSVFLTTGGPTQYPRDVSLCGYTGGDDLKEKSRCAAPFPPGFRLQGNPILSQTGQRLLWHAAPFTSPGTTNWTQKIKDALSMISPGQRVSLWSSDLEGGSMREIGFVTLTGRSDSYPGLYACWLPDGQRISFVHHDTLYVAVAK